MAQLIVRNLEMDVKLGLKQFAARNGWSMEESVRLILRRAVNEEIAQSQKLGSLIAKRFNSRGLKKALPELHGQNISPADFHS